MNNQIGLAEEARAPTRDLGNGLHGLADDLAYLRLSIVNVVFYGRQDAGDRGWVLFDTGLATSEDAIRNAAAILFGEAARPSAIVLTHGHFDHVGSVASLAQEWDVPVYAHALELPYLDGTASYPPADPFVGGGVMALLSPLYPRSPIDISARLAVLPADRSVPGMPGWRWLHTPGHAPGHVALWREGDRTLIAGDAVITTGQESAYEVMVQQLEIHGPPRYFTPDWGAAHRSAQLIARLEPELLITGHGAPAIGPAMRHGLQQLARDFETIAVPQDGKYVRDPATADNGDVYRR